MTGTAMTEAGEFARDLQARRGRDPDQRAGASRKDDDDEVYRTAAEKTRAIVELIEDCRAAPQPVLVGTVSIEKSEALSEQLKKAKIPHTC